jgi:hypothetical protein
LASVGLGNNPEDLIRRSPAGHRLRCLADTRVLIASQLEGRGVSAIHGIDLLGRVPRPWGWPGRRRYERKFRL